MIPVRRGRRGTEKLRPSELAPGECPPYTKFADIYDAVMRDVSYPMWVDYVGELCARHGLAPTTILDVACGTGGATLPFAQRGYRVAGVDASRSMLSVARSKAAALDLPVEFALQDMRRLKPEALALGPTFDLVLCLYDSINYLTDPGELEAALPGFLASLRPGGLLIFDVNSARRLSLMTETVLFLEGPGWSFIEQNEYDPASFMWEIRLTAFVRSRGDLFRRFTETHWERSYSEAEMRGMLDRSGFTTLAAYAAFSLQPATADTARTYFVAQRPKEKRTFRHQRD